MSRIVFAPQTCAQVFPRVNALSATTFVHSKQKESSGQIHFTTKLVDTSKTFPVMIPIIVAKSAAPIVASFVHSDVASTIATTTSVSIAPVASARIVRKQYRCAFTQARSRSIWSSKPKTCYKDCPLCGLPSTKGKSSRKRVTISEFLARNDSDFL